MAQATVKTVQYLDPRIEPQPDPVYDHVIAPTQNQYYRIPASGLSNSSIHFNNLTTLGVDRAYLDTFEIELGVTITFNVHRAANASDNDKQKIIPHPGDWTFDSFPFNKCCDEARVNINGGAFFSQPMSYIRAKERYMNQWELSKCYENVCPCHRAELQTESSRNYCDTRTNNHINGLSGDDAGYPADELGIRALRTGIAYELVTNSGGDITGLRSATSLKPPSRYGSFIAHSLQSSQGLSGGFNNAIVRRGGAFFDNGGNHGYPNYYMNDTGTQTVVKVTWREPIFVSPFSSRYDATYGRPLYNITSMDLSFTLQNLGNMIRLMNTGSYNGDYVTGYTINIDSARLCYQVMTIPPILNKPLTTLVPYRRFVPYITDYHQALAGDPSTNVPSTGDKISITSGVYTFNEMPTAIWVYCQPCKADLQTNEPDDTGLNGPDAIADLAQTPYAVGNWDTNRLFGFIKRINISMANTTQILATADIPDLYRIAKANGCEDSYLSWAGDDVVTPDLTGLYGVQTGALIKQYVKPMYFGAGSVLRLKPGVDLIVPDQPLIPGSNANNMVFQCTAEFYVPPHSPKHARYSLWLLFEYVGVAAISPGQCEITMNPLGSGEIMAVSPVMSATSDATEGNLEGSGFWDIIKKAARISGQLADDGIINMILKRIPGTEGAQKWLEAHNFGAQPASKRPRGGAQVGGAVMGKGGMNDWM